MILKRFKWKIIQMDKIYLILIILMFQSSKINSQNVEFDSSINAFIKELFISNNYKFLTSKSKVVVGDKFLSPKIFFEYDGGQHVAKESIDSLTQIINFLKQNSNHQICIEIHSDLRGFKEYNLAMTRRKAENLFREIQKISGNKTFRNVQFKSIGGSYPIITNNQINTLSKKYNSNQLHQINDRIEIKIITRK